MRPLTRNEKRASWWNWLIFLSIGLILPYTAFAKDCGSNVPDGNLQTVANCVLQRAKSKLIIVGELHGTSQIPELVLDMVRTASRHGPVRIGLEMPQASEAVVQQFVRSDGGATDVKRLKQLDFWKLPDGRATVAVLNMIKAVRTLHHEGYDVGIFAMEPNYPDPAKATLDYKERGMAAAISSTISSSPKNTRLIALMGSYHARFEGEFIGSSGLSVTERLANRHPDVLLVNGRSVSAWTCLGRECGVHQFKKDPAGSNESADIEVGTRMGSVTVFDLTLPKLSPSVPIGPTYK